MGEIGPIRREVTFEPIPELTPIQEPEPVPETEPVPA